MKKRKRLKKILRFSLQNMLIVLLIFLFALLVYAADQGLMGYKSLHVVGGRGGDQLYDINSLTTYYSKVEEHGTCKKIQYNTCSNDVFIPTKTSLEWTTFIAHKPSCINLTGCYVAPPVVCDWSAWTTVSHIGTCGDGTSTSNYVFNPPSVSWCKTNGCDTDTILQTNISNPSVGCVDYKGTIGNPDLPSAFGQGLSRRQQVWSRGIGGSCTNTDAENECNDICKSVNSNRIGGIVKHDHNNRGTVYCNCSCSKFEARTWTCN